MPRSACASARPGRATTARSRAARAPGHSSCCARSRPSSSSASPERAERLGQRAQARRALPCASPCRSCTPSAAMRGAGQVGSSVGGLDVGGPAGRAGRAPRRRAQHQLRERVLRLQGGGLIRGGHGFALLVLGILSEPGQGEGRLRLGELRVRRPRPRAPPRARERPGPARGQRQRESGAGRGRARLELEGAPIRGLGLRVQPGRAQRVAARHLDRGRVGSGARGSLGGLACRDRVAQPGLRAREGREAFRRWPAPRPPGARTPVPPPPCPRAGRSADWIARTRARTGAGAAPASSPAFASALPASSSLPSREVHPRERERRLRIARRLRRRLLEDLDRLGFLALARAGPRPS